MGDSAINGPDEILNFRTSAMLALFIMYKKVNG